MALVLLLLGARFGAAPCDRIDTTALVFRATALVFRDTGSEKAMLRSHANIRLVVVAVIDTGVRWCSRVLMQWRE